VVEGRVVAVGGKEEGREGGREGLYVSSEEATNSGNSCLFHILLFCPIFTLPFLPPSLSFNSPKILINPRRRKFKLVRGTPPRMLTHHPPSVVPTMEIPFVQI